jgi:hypothetical protein
MKPIKDGYYWVKNGTEWTIAEYDMEGWWLIGTHIQYDDHEFDSFYPIPIELPDILKDKDG